VHINLEDREIFLLALVLKFVGDRLQHDRRCLTARTVLFEDLNETVLEARVLDYFLFKVVSSDLGAYQLAWLAVRRLIVLQVTRLIVQELLNEVSQHLVYLLRRHWLDLLHWDLLWWKVQSLSIRCDFLSWVEDVGDGNTIFKLVCVDDLASHFCIISVVDVKDLVIVIASQNLLEELLEVIHENVLVVDE